MTPGEWNIKLLEPSFALWKPQKPSSKQIVVLMSGGVDSSVAAYLLKKDGWDVLGITMKIPVSAGIGGRGCCGVDAAFVCNELGIPHYFIDVTEAFERLIIGPFRRSYANGETPNPCVDCNMMLKFSLVWDFLRATFGVDYLATGHYVKVSRDCEPVRLGRAADRAKDQSYFLYGIAAEKLPYFVLPLGELTKEAVRSIAAEINLTVAEKPESMELCFADAGDYRQALSDNKTERCGDITDMQGNKIGTHNGISHYTLGQRRGVGVARGKVVYVSKIDPMKNTIALGTREEISFETIRADRVNVFVPGQLMPDCRLFGKIRSYGDPKPCKVIDCSAAEVTVEFDEPQFAPCPGQKLVLYDSFDNIVAGGTIVTMAE